jgi:acyl-coenzyme A synthetase/AMP-(fatty) acid ligase
LHPVDSQPQRGRDGGRDPFWRSRPGRTLERAEIEHAANAELGRIKQVPVHIDFVAAMPRNDMGKIDRRALREEIIRTRIRTGGSRAP